MVDRQFDLAEVKILITAIQAASFFTKHKTETLTAKVASLSGSHKAAVLKGNLVTLTPESTQTKLYFILKREVTGHEIQFKFKFLYTLLHFN